MKKADVHSTGTSGSESFFSALQIMGGGLLKIVK